MRSGFVTVVGRGAQLVLQLGLAMVLARLLSAEDYGVQAMVYPVALLVQGVVNSGLQSAIIQHQDLDDVQASALFWASLRWNALFCAVFALSGFGLVALNREPRVLPVSVAWAVVTFGGTLSAIHEALLKRQFRFGTVLGAHLAALVCSIVVAIVAAKVGLRYWAIILQMAVVELGRVAIIWARCSWRPMSPSRLGAAQATAAAELTAYWRGFAGARFLGWIGEQVDRLTVGVIGGAALSGLYDYAKKWGTFAFLELYTPLSEVAIASISSVRTDAALLATYVRNAFLPVLAISLPILGFLFAEPQGFLHVLFGDRWVASAGMLRAIALGVAVGSIGRLATWVSLSLGQTARQFRWTVWSTPVYLVGALVGARWGGQGVANGVMLANVLTAVPCVHYLLATTPLRRGAVLQTWLVPLLASAGGVGMLRVVGAALPDAATWPGLMLRGLVFCAAYGAGWLVLPGGRAMLQALRASVEGRPRNATTGP